MIYLLCLLSCTVWKLYKESKA